MSTPSRAAACKEPRPTCDGQRVDVLVSRVRDGSLDMICIAGFDGYFKKLNPAWERILGFDIKTLLARPFIDFVHPDDVEASLEEATRLVDGERFRPP